MKDGLNTFCKPCHQADNIARKVKNRANKDFRNTEAESKKIYREKTVKERALYMIDWRGRNKEHVSTYSKQYRDNNKEKYAFLCQKRKLDTMKRTPAWLSQDDFWMIEEAYLLAALRTKMLGVPHHVDHILPLRGKKVSGLHVPLNLRVIPAIENMRKTNKFEV
jgi:hypothetical protein